MSVGCISKIISTESTHILVEGDLSNTAVRELVLRPGLGQVKDRVPEFLRLLWCHDLNSDVPGWELALRNGLEQILGSKVGVGASELGGLLIVEPLLALLG